MRLHVSSRWGHFNWANPDDESLDCTITAIDDDGKVLGRCSIKPDDEIDTDYFDLETIADDVAELIEKHQKRVFFSTSKEKDLAFAKWLREHKEEIADGNIRYFLQQLKDQKARMESDLEALTERVRIWELGLAERNKQ